MNNREAAYKHFMQEEMRIGKSYQDIFNAGYQAALASQAQKESKPVMPVGFLDHGGIFYSYREKIKDGTELYAIPPAPEGE